MANTEATDLWTSGTTPPADGSRPYEQEPRFQHDLGPCSRCRSMAGVVVRGFPRLHGGASTAIGCVRCDHFIECRSELRALALWNLEAIETTPEGEWHPDPALYEIILREAEAEEAAQKAREDRARWLDEHTKPACPWPIGTRVRDDLESDRTWSITGVRAVWGVNTGAIWIADARDVLPNGRLGERDHEFWQNATRHPTVVPLASHMAARWWHQVHAGDSCQLDGRAGTIEEVNRDSRTATLRIDGAQLRVSSLAGLFVPTCRLERVGSGGDGRS